MQRHDAHRADAGLGQALELGLGRAPGFTTATPFASLPSSFIDFNVTRVVVAIGVGLHDDHALMPEPLLQLAVHRHGEMAREFGVPGAALAAPS